MTLTVATIENAKQAALTEWRKLVDDEEAELPWDTDFEITIVNSGTPGIGSSVSVAVTIELDDVDTVLAVAKT